MRIIAVEQGTDEWKAARLGIPTASCFDLIVTKTGKASTSAKKYKARLLGEWYTGCPADDYVSPYMQRGSSMEKAAVDYYAFTTGSRVEKVGLCVTDDGLIGASPDRLVDDDGLLEIKCLSAENHILNLTGKDTSLDHRPQVQGQLYVTGRKWCDLLFYHPTIRSIVRRVERDEKYLAILDRELRAFVEDMKAKRAELDATRPKYEEDSVPF